MAKKIKENCQKSASCVSIGNLSSGQGTFPCEKTPKDWLCRSLPDMIQPQNTDRVVLHAPLHEYLWPPLQARQNQGQTLAIPASTFAHHVAAIRPWVVGQEVSSTTAVYRARRVQNPIICWVIRAIHSSPPLVFICFGPAYVDGMDKCRHVFLLRAHLAW